MRNILFSLQVQFQICSIFIFKYYNATEFNFKACVFYVDEEEFSYNNLEEIRKDATLMIRSPVSENCVLFNLVCMTKLDQNGETEEEIDVKIYNNNEKKHSLSTSGTFYRLFRGSLSPRKLKFTNISEFNIVHVNGAKSYRRVYSRINIIISIKIPSRVAMNRVDPVLKKPEIVNKFGKKVIENETLLLGDYITCQYPIDEKPKPKPSLYWIYDNTVNYLEEEEITMRDDISLHVRRLVSPGYYKVCCMAMNVLFGLQFIKKQYATVSVIQPPQALEIKPMKSFFFENETITCTVKGANEGCEWIHVLGTSVLQQKSDGSRCYLNISTVDRRKRLFGGFYEYTCMGRGKQNYGNLFQRKIFHVFVPLTIPPSCPACEADSRRDGYFVCQSNDKYNYPEAFVEWKLLSGDANNIFMKDNELMVPPKDAHESEREVTFRVICVATDRLKLKENDRWGNLTSPVYVITGNSIICALNLNSVIQLIVLYFILFVFLVVDIFICVFISASRYLANASRSS